MTRRRSFLSYSAAGLLGLNLSPAAIAAARGNAASASASAEPIHWQNWSGIRQCTPREWLSPRSLDELADVLKRGPGPLRCVGAGHSFTPLVPTSGTLLSLDNLSGLVHADAEAGRATLGAGTRIAVGARLLDDAGLAFVNQPDIDVQSLAGAMATATHGTGRELRALHAELQSLKLMTPTGELIECSPTQRPEVFRAAQVSLGSLGVITEMTLNVVPRHFLRRHVWLAPTDELLAQAETLAAQHHHFELYLLPFTGCGAAIGHDLAPIGKPVHPPAEDDNVLRDLQRLRDWFGNFPSMRRWIAAKAIGAQHEDDAVDVSYALLSSVRPTRFNESECHVPREQGVACLREVLATLEKRNDVFFPMEFRFTKADDAWLSPFHERDSCSIAVHALAGEPYDYLLTEVGPVFRRHGGRPHWGKLHNFSPAELAAAYPRWRDWHEVRQSLDPQGRMLTPAVAATLGIAMPAAT